MHCSHCDQEHPENIRFCPVTGEKIIQAEVCSQCGQPVEPDWQHCAFCGSRLVATLPTPETVSAMPAGIVPPLPEPAPIQQATRPKYARPRPVYSILALILILALAAVMLPALSPRPAGEKATVQMTASITSQDEVISAGDQYNAEQAFAQGLMIYLFAPQPSSVSISSISGTTFSLRYLCSPAASNLNAGPMLAYVGADGGKQSKLLWDPLPSDCKTPSGRISISLNPAGDSLERAFSKMGGKIQIITPVSIELSIHELVTQSGSTGYGPKVFSNVIQIPVTAAEAQSPTP